MLVLIGDDFNEMLDMHTQKINVLYLNEQLIVRIFDLQESVGIRLNQEPPNIYFKLKKTGGISFTSTVNLTRMDEKMIQMILHEYKFIATKFEDF